ncbi:MAG: hypothetical protein O2917_02450 [Acidobacteria bacterium]|nr:hypothetical protein [Acidobacteriota bacterium]
MSTLQFKEIEHKFIVPASFDLARFRDTLETMRPTRHAVLRVRDRYFITEAGQARGFVLRHRHDRELHELTLKTVVGDAEVRDEVNLKLRPEDQDVVVDAFVAAQGIVWQGALWKDLEVWHFADCEVVHYVATADDQTVHCVEFEATTKTTLAEALAVVARYEKATGFADAVRTPASLVDLLWPGVLDRLRAGAPVRD